MVTKLTCIKTNRATLSDLLAANQILFILFNESDILHPGSETVASHIRMNMVWMMNGSRMIPGDECCLNFLTFVLQLRKEPIKKFQPGIEHGPAG